MASLTGKVAVVTGGSRGIGLEVARALRDRGAQVAITATSDQTLRTALDDLQRTPGTGVVPLRADVRRYDEVRQAVDVVVQRFGGIDILVNNAGVGIFRRVAEMPLEDWNQVIDTNLTGVFHCCHAALPHLKARGAGWIINVSSLASANAFPEAAAYCASKAGLNAFSEALMQEVRYDDIRVTYVMPGSVATGFAGNEEKGADWKIASEDVADVVLNLLHHDPRSLPSRVELRPSKPRKH